VNTVDPIGDAGLLSHLIDASSILPLLVVTIAVGVFFVSWAIAAGMDSTAQREGGCMCMCMLVLSSSFAMPHPARYCLFHEQSACAAQAQCVSAVQTEMPWQPSHSLSHSIAAALSDLRKAHLLTYGYVKRGLGQSVLHLPDDHPERLRIKAMEVSLMVRGRQYLHHTTPHHTLCTCHTTPFALAPCHTTPSALAHTHHTLCTCTHTPHPLHLHTHRTLCT
jgi:hypothetical protein